MTTARRCPRNRSAAQPPATVLRYDSPVYHPYKVSARPSLQPRPCTRSTREGTGIAPYAVVLSPPPSPGGKEQERPAGWPGAGPLGAGGAGHWRIHPASQRWNLGREPVKRSGEGVTPACLSRPP